MARIALECPVCGAISNFEGRHWPSSWAVACHVVSSAKRGNSEHREWIGNRLGAPGEAWLQAVPSEANLSEQDKSIGRLIKPLVAQHLASLEAQLNRETGSPLAIITNLELVLHEHVKRRLVDHHGEEAWWRDGVPEQIRVECVQRREIARASEEPFKFTYLIDLRTILDKSWVLFLADLERIKPSCPTKKEFLAQLDSLNQVRNRYAHPIRAPKQGSDEHAADIGIVASIATLVGEFCG